MWTNTTRRSGWYGYWYIALGWGTQIFLTRCRSLFSHHVEAIPLRDLTAKSIVNAFLGGWIYRSHRVPIVLVTDQGNNVDGTAVHKLCQELGIQNATLLRTIPKQMVLLSDTLALSSKYTALSKVFVPH